MNATSSFHVSNLGSFGSNLPSKGGFCTYNIAEYNLACVALREGRSMPEGLKGARRNAWLVRKAELAVNAWRASE